MSSRGLRMLFTVPVTPRRRLRRNTDRTGEDLVAIEDTVQLMFHRILVVTVYLCHLCILKEFGW